MKLALLPRTDLAVQVLRFLDGNGWRTAGVIAEAIGSTARYVPHVMAPLVAAGWIESSRGPTGGYRMADGPNDLSFLDVIEAVEGPTDNGRCILEDKSCPSSAVCALHEAWSAARSALRSELDQVPVLEKENSP